MDGGGGGGRGDYILVRDSHTACIFKDTMKEHIWEKYFGPQHISFANGGDKIENLVVDGKQVQSPWWL